MQKYWIYVAFALLFSTNHLWGNSPTSDDDKKKSEARINIKASYNLGFMLAHRTKMQHIPKELTHGFEISFEKQSKNEEDWEKLYRNARVGVAFLATGTGNYDILGTAYGLNGYVLFPLINTKRFSLNTSIGWGLGVLSKKFDPITNYENNTIGSNLNLFAAIKLMADLNLTPKLALSAGVNFHHWSNSAFKYPNLGLNVPSATLGLVYRFQEQEQYVKLTKKERKLIVPKEKNEITIIPSVGFKAYNIHDNSTYSAYTLEFNYARIWSLKYKVSGGVDFFYNTAYQRELEIAVDAADRSNSAFQTGINITYHQTMGTFSILLGMGAYVYDKTLQNEMLYHKFGTRFMIKDRIIISTVLHTHWARADHLKLGIGYKFRK